MSSLLSLKPSEWEFANRGAIKAGEAYIAEHHELPDTPLWKMLDTRYELNTPRFRFWHPVSASILDSLTTCRSEYPARPDLPYDHFPQPPVYTLPTTGDQVVPDCPPSPVAEPGSVISLMIGVVLLACWSVGRMR